MSFEKALSQSGKKLSWSRLLARYRHDIFYSFINMDVDGLEDIGRSDWKCSWMVRTKGLDSNSVIYSAGVGRDISFEHELADRFGCKVILIDPSPTGLETLSEERNKRPEFIAVNKALAGHDGVLVLSPPRDADEGSWVSVVAENPGDVPQTDSIQVPCVTIRTLMEQNGHTQIDLLKMDIEGAEYGVLEAVMSSGVTIKQIAVEYHNKVIPGFTAKQTMASLLKLRKLGYRLIYKMGSNHTLLLKSQA